MKNDDKRCRNQFIRVFRRERGICQICWSTTAEGDFELTSSMTGASGLFWTQFFMILGQIFLCIKYHEEVKCPMPDSNPL